MTNMSRTTILAAVGLMVLMLTFATGGARVAAQGMKPLLVQIMNTAEVPVPVVSPIDRVLLRTQGGVPTGVCPNYARELQRVLPDGTFAESFTVPPGKMLVLTDLEALVEQRPDLTWSIGDLVSVSAFFGNVLSAVITAHGPLTADALSAEIATVSMHLQTGGVIGPNHAVCVSAGIDRVHGGYAADLAEARLHGYLIAE
jgi:hypothetical protein